MKKILAMLLSVAIIATIAITGSVAYLTSTDSDINTMVMGNVKIEQHEKDRDGNDFENNKPLYPMVFDNELGSNPPTTPNTTPKTPETNSETGLWTGIVGAQDKIVTVENKGKSPAYVRTWFAFEADEDGTLKYIHINWNKREGINVVQYEKDGTKVFEIDNEKYVIYCVTYPEALAVGATSAASLLQVGMDRAADNTYVEQFGATYDILVYIQAGQVENMSTDPKTALDLMFGTSHPWREGVNVETGDIIIRTADDLLALGGTSIYENKRIVLANDIDMGGDSMNTILIDAIVKFDGNHHTISNVKLNSNVSYGFSTAAMFDVAPSDSNRPAALTVENVNFEKITVTGSKIDDPDSAPYEPIGAAVVVGYVDKASSVTLNNVNVSKSTITNEYGEAAALVGYSYSSVAFNNCKVTDCTIVGEEKTYSERDMDGEYNTAIVVDTSGKYRKNSAFVGTVNGWGQNSGLTLTITDCVNGTNKPDWHRYFTTTITGSAKQVITISTKAELIAFANELNGGNINKYFNKTVMLTNDIDLENAAWTPIGYSGNYPTNLTFDGNGHTIKNLNVSRTEKTGDSSTGLFGWTAGVKIKNLTIDGATVVGSHNCGVIVGHADNHEDTNSTIENCHVKNATITCIHDSETSEPKCDCGDKAGAIAGAALSGTKIKNCSASNCTIKAARDAGQIVGAAKDANVTGCSAADSVTVTADTTGCSHESAGVTIGGIIGRKL